MVEYYQIMPLGRNLGFCLEVLAKNDGKMVIVSNSVSNNTARGILSFPAKGDHKDKTYYSIDNEDFDVAGLYFLLVKR